MAIFSGPGKGPEPTDHPRRRKSDLVPLSVIGHDMTVIGDLETQGVVKIEGRVQGTVRGGAEILISPGAVVEGDIHAREVVVGGEVRGVIHASERVELQASASVIGDIHTQRIVILEGGRVSGEVKVEAQNSALAAESSPQ